MSLQLILMLILIVVFLIIPSFKDRIISVRKLAIMPAVFMCLFYFKITETFHISILSWYILLGLVFGVAGGILIRSKTPVIADKNRSLIKLPGSFLNLMIFIMIFSVNFVIGYFNSVSPGYFSSVNMTSETLFFLLSFASSLTVGASLCLYMKYRTAISDNF